MKNYPIGNGQNCVTEGKKTAKMNSEVFFDLAFISIEAIELNGLMQVTVIKSESVIISPEVFCISGIFFRLPKINAGCRKCEHSHLPVLMATCLCTYTPSIHAAFPGCSGSVYNGSS